MTRRITIYWDSDGDGWAWRYGDRSGAYDGCDPLASDRADVESAARDAVADDPIGPMRDDPSLCAAPVEIHDQSGRVRP